jgi:glutathione-independent formaldehyde dehydrogenase
MLADIFPTGYHATEMANVKPGDQTVIYGVGPVGCMAAYSAVIKGASKVMVVDRHPDRLRKAEEIGAIPIDDSAVDPVEAINEMTMGLGADNGCECVGYQAHDPEGHEHPNMTLNRLVRSVRFTGDLGVMRFRYFHRPHRRREVAPRRHPIPDLVKIALQVLLEVRDRASVHARCTLIALDLLPRLPYFPLRNVERLA